MLKKNMIAVERCTWCHELFPSNPHQMGTFLEYREFMCVPCSKKYEASNSETIEALNASIEYDEWIQGVY